MSEKKRIKALVNKRAWEIAQVMFYQYQADIWNAFVKGEITEESILEWFPEEEKTKPE